MKPLGLLVTSLLAAPWLFPATSQAAIIITEVMSSSAHTGGTNNGDWFEITNTGASAVDLTGWSWDDNGFSPGAANFGSITSIAAGQSIIFTEEDVGAANENAWRSNWGLTAATTVVNLGGGVFQGLGSGGDSVAIYNNSNTEVTRVTFGTATGGRSFEWDRNGNSLGLSLAGENGALVAVSNGQTANNGAGTDIGSPGFSVAAVPEPSWSLLALVGIFSATFLRRRQRQG